jgi:16S rRNA (guanine966-N2)-methyltransferase
MTRIIAGEFGGRRLLAPHDRRIRPTADRVREAWMSILGPRLPGARVLDLCAGTGALGLEALSRGAASAEFVERAPAALELLRRNIEALGVADRTRVTRADALEFIERLRAAAYDVALADPPYATDYADRLVAAFRRVPFASVLAVEHGATQDLPGDDVRRYGDTALTFCYAP